MPPQLRRRPHHCRVDPPDRQSGGDRLTSTGKGASAAKYQSIKDLYDALTICKFSPLKVIDLCEIYTAITGFGMDPEGWLATGDRSVNLKRAINMKPGLPPAHDRLPRIAGKALNDGATAEKGPDMAVLLDEYYRHRGWDPATGKSLKKTLEALGLDQVIRDFHPDT